MEDGAQPKLSWELGLGLGGFLKGLGQYAKANRVSLLFSCIFLSLGLFGLG